MSTPFDLHVGPARENTPALKLRQVTLCTQARARYYEQMITALQARLEVARVARIFPGYTFVYLAGGTVEYCAGGAATYDADSWAVSPETVYDVASLTKIIGPMAVAMQLIDEGTLHLDEPVGNYIPEYNASPNKQVATIAHLLTYTIDYDIPGGSKSLLPGLTPTEIRQTVFEYPLHCLPGTKYQYSNLTAFILAQVIERALGEPFEKVVEERIMTPLGMQTATFTPAATECDAIPPTERTEERGVVQGFVHDEFSYYLKQGGIGNGAAGLFASVKDLAPFLQMTIQRGQFNGRQFFSESIVRYWNADYWPELLPNHTPIGWGDLNNALIDDFHREIVVKGGFTGCFMAADLKQGIAFALLSNRTYPTRPENSEGFAALKKDLMHLCFGTRRGGY